MKIHKSYVILSVEDLPMRRKRVCIILLAVLMAWETISMTAGATINSIQSQNAENEKQ